MTQTATTAAAHPVAADLARRGLTVLDFNSFSTGWTVVVANRTEACAVVRTVANAFEADPESGLFSTDLLAAHTGEAVRVTVTFTR